MSDAWPRMIGNKAIYVTDDRDLPPDEQRSLVIYAGGNGDWYVQVAPLHGRTMDGVRLCTSGGASSACPGLTGGIAQAFRAISAAASGRPLSLPSYEELEQEVSAWRANAASYEFDGRSGEIVSREDKTF